MKILYLYQHFVLPEKSGITRTYEFARRLAAYGHTVHLIAADETSEKASGPYSTEHSGITIHWLPIPYKNAMPFHLRIVAFIKYAIGALRIGRHIECDLIYISSPPLTAALPALFLARQKKVPMVLEVRDLWPDLPILFKALRNPVTIAIARQLERFSYRQAKHIVALSPGIRAAVIARGAPEEKTSLIPNSCDTEHFKSTSDTEVSLPKEIRAGDSVILYPGTIGIANGVSYIVQLAHHTLKTHPNLKYLIVGEGKEKNRIRELARKLGVLETNLFLMDPIPKARIPALYQRASIILNTLVDHKALWNSSPNKFFDSLAAGKPVAINFNGWLADLIKEHDIGLVLDPTDTFHASQTLAQALSRPLWAEKTGRNAHKLGSARFDRDKLAHELNLILLEVTHQQRDQATFKKVSR